MKYKYRGKIMKVKIIKSSKKDFWYVNHINETFEVEDIGHLIYRVKNSSNLINKEDVEIKEDNYGNNI